MTETHLGFSSADLARAAAFDRAGRHEQAVDLLRQGAQSGSAAAACALGLRLLVGHNAPFDPQQGIALLTTAAGQGEPEALAQMATLKAAGAWMPQNWAEGLDLLQQAAERGSVRARGQLAVLAGDRALAARARARTDPRSAAC